jgi:hypothetical protein
VMFGDAGLMYFIDGKIVLAQTTPMVFTGSNMDYMDGNEGTDVLFGGEGTDTMLGEFPTDAKLGSFGSVVFKDGKIFDIYPPLEGAFMSPLNRSYDNEESAAYVTGPGSVRIEQGQAGSPERASFMEQSGWTVSETIHHAAYTQSMNSSGLSEGATLMPDGSIQTRRKDGSVVIKTADGSVMIQRADGTVTRLSAQGARTVLLPDGTVIVTLVDGTIVTIMPDGRVITALTDGSVQTIMDEKEDNGFGINPNMSLMNDLQKPEEFSKNSNIIKLSSLVAGLTGWGINSSSASPSDNSTLDRDGFNRLEKNMKIRRFLRWKEGRFVKDAKETHRTIDRKKLH